MCSETDRFSTRRVVAFCAAAAAAGVTSSALAQVNVFDNGTFVTEVGTGAGGANVSRAESSVLTIGMNANASPPIRIADDFVITTPSGVGAYSLSRLTFYGVQSNSITNNVQFGAFYIALYDGDPTIGGNQIAGDFVTNRLISSTFSGTYRLSSTGTVTASTRPITRLEVDMSWAPALHSGTYWMVVSAVGDTALTASPNPQTIFVTPHLPTANAWQQFNNSWFAIWDPPFTLQAFCPADFDKVDGVNVQDIFSFLNTWFTGNQAADFDGVNGVEVSDIFGFLNAWFAGC